MVLNKQIKLEELGDFLRNTLSDPPALSTYFSTSDTHIASSRSQGSAGFAGYDGCAGTALLSGHASPVTGMQRGEFTLTDSPPYVLNFNRMWWSMILT